MSAALSDRELGRLLLAALRAYHARRRELAASGQGGPRAKRLAVQLRRRLCEQVALLADLADVGEIGPER